MNPENNDIPPCLIHIDKEGKWFHRGDEMIHREFIRLFYENMYIDSQGRYIINWEGEDCYVEVEDTAYVIWRVSFEGDDISQPVGFVINLSDDSKEELNPDTLWVGDANVLYCKVKNGVFPARFNRPSYYQLAEYIEEDHNGYFLPLNEKRYYIRLSPGDDG